MMRNVCATLVAAGLLLAAVVTQGDEMLGDIHIPRAGGEGLDFMPEAIFPHWVHRTEFKCYVCHDEIFQMKAGADHITMDEIRNGRFCGKCHDGKTAFAVGFNSCNRCHRTLNDGP